MQGRYFMTFGSDQLQDYEFPGGAASVMLVSPVGYTEDMFRAAMAKHPDIGTRFCTTYPLEEAHEMSIKYGMTTYDLQEFNSRRL